MHYTIRDEIILYEYNVYAYERKYTYNSMKCLLPIRRSRSLLLTAQHPEDVSTKGTITLSEQLLGLLQEPHLQL